MAKKASKVLTPFERHKKASKKKIASLKWDLRQAKQNLKRRNDEVFELQTELNDLKKTGATDREWMERFVSEAYKSRDWARDTLRLMAVPKGREKQLAKIISEDHDPSRLGFRGGQY